VVRLNAYAQFGLDLLSQCVNLPIAMTAVIGVLVQAIKSAGDSYEVHFSVKDTGIGISQTALV